MKQDQLLISIDLSGAEWFCVGYLADEPQMIEVHQKHQSPHARTGSLMTGGLPEDLIEREDKLLGKITDPDTLQKRREIEIPEIFLCGASWLPTIMTCRQAGKKSNHGFNYDLQYRRFSLENLIPERDAMQMEEQYKEVAYPGLRRRYYPSIQQELHGGEECVECGQFRLAYIKGKPRILWMPLGKSTDLPERHEACQVCGARRWKERPPRLLRNCFGRKVCLLGGWGPDLYQQGYSFKPQSTVADSIIQGFCELYEDPNPAYQKAYIWNTTHDELTVQFPIEPDLTDMAATILKLTQALLVPEINYPPHRFRLYTDTKIGFRYGDPSGPDKTDGLIPLKFKEPTTEAVVLALQDRLDFLGSEERRKAA